MRQALIFDPVASPFKGEQREGAQFDLFWKEALPEGTWKHPTRGFTLKVDKERLDRLAENFKKQQERKISVPVPSGHAYSEREGNGHVEGVEVRQRDDGKWSLFTL